jgi:hypothetical protein
MVLLQTSRPRQLTSDEQRNFAGGADLSGLQISPAWYAACALYCAKVNADLIIAVLRFDIKD